MKSGPVNPGHASITIQDNKPVPSASVKQKRPFRINQICSINLPLPETLIENSGTFSNSTCEFKEIHERPNKKLEIIKPQNITSNVILPQEQSPIIVENLSPEYETPTFDFEPVDHILDQSMFDPKILLQTMNVATDEEIIPPPPEFRDTFDSDIHQEIFHNACYDMDLPDFDNPIVNPNTKEIEKWTLSSNTNVWSMANTTAALNEDKRTYAMPQDTFSSINNLKLPRLHKLGQFSFSRKEKLKK